MFQIAGVGTVTGPLPSLNTRHFVVGTYDRTTMRLYLDGTQVGQIAATGRDPRDQRAGRDRQQADVDRCPRDPFPGVLDEVSIHNVALSAAQVGQLWTTGTTGSGGGGSNTPPVPVIDTPAASVTWKVGDTISFTGHASDAEDGTLAASRLSWSLILEHCPSNCHTHSIQSWSGVASGSFQAPDHDYPSDLLLTLTATDSAGTPVSTSVKLDPKTVVLSFASSPTGLQLTHNGVGGDSTVHPDGHPRLRELDQCRSEPDAGRPELRVPVLVRRRCTGPHGDRRQLDDAHGHVYAHRWLGPDVWPARGHAVPGRLLAPGGAASWSSVGPGGAAGDTDAEVVTQGNWRRAARLGLG